MNVTAYVKMGNEELASEIEKQKKKIKQAQETIKLLEKLMIAENSKAQKGNFSNNDGNRPQRAVMQNNEV